MAGHTSGPPRILPDVGELHRLLVVQGKTQAEVARQYGVTRAAVSAAVDRLGVKTKKPPRYADYIPWTVRVEHQKAYPLRMLRLYARRQMGMPNSEKDDRYLSAFVQRLEDIGGVVDYDREEGFSYVPAEAGDEGIVRRPEE